MVLYENRILRRNDVIFEPPFLEKNKQSSRPVTEYVPGKTAGERPFLYLAFFLPSRLSRFQILTFFSL